MASAFNGKITNPNFPDPRTSFAQCEVTDRWGDFTGICARLMAYRSPLDGLRFMWVASATNARSTQACFESIQLAIEFAHTHPSMRDVQEFAYV